MPAKQSESSIYQAYLVRFWRDKPSGFWRVSLQSTTTEELRHFATIEALWVFLQTRRGQGYVLTHLGYTLSALADWQGAAAVLAQALAIRQESGERGLAIDTLAGCALVVLGHGEVVDALRSVDEVLAWLAAHGPAAVEFPIQVYLNCYKILRALGDHVPAGLERRQGDCGHDGIDAGRWLEISHHQILDKTFRREPLPLLTASRQIIEDERLFVAFRHILLQIGHGNGPLRRHPGCGSTRYA